MVCVKLFYLLIVLFCFFYGSVGIHVRQEVGKVVGNFAQVCVQPPTLSVDSPATP